MPPKEKYTDPKLRDEVKEELHNSDKGGAPGQWSARKAQMMASEYKKRGGEYNTDKSEQDESQRNLSKWGEEDWQTKEGSGHAKKEDGTEKRYLPKKAWEEMSEKEKEETDQKKQAESKKGKQFVANTDKAKDSRKKATEENEERKGNGKENDENEEEEEEDEEQDNGMDKKDDEEEEDKTTGKGQNDQGKKRQANGKRKANGNNADEKHEEGADGGDAEEHHHDDEADDDVDDDDDEEDNYSEEEEEEEEGDGDYDDEVDDANNGDEHDKEEESKEDAKTGQKRKSEQTNGPSKKQKSGSSSKSNGGTVGSKHMPDEEPAPRGSSDRLPKQGQKATWKAMPGYVDGEVVEVLTQGKSVEGKSVKASKDDPKIVLQSSSSGKICVHKPDACFYD